jgi:hypothetical protein
MQKDSSSMKTFGLLVAALVVCSWSGVARAEVALSAEAQVGFLVPNDVAFVVGGAARAGYAFDSLYPILVMPELSLDAQLISSGIAEPAIRATGGARFGILAVVEPSIYVHAGYGGLQTNPFSVGPDGDWISAFTLDAGAALDYRIARWITLGGSLGYLGYFTENAMHGGILGVHATFWL